MTRKSIIARENKRLKTVKKYAAKRAAFKKAFLTKTILTKIEWLLLRNYKNYLGMQVHQGS